MYCFFLRRPIFCWRGWKCKSRKIEGHAPNIIINPNYIYCLRYSLPPFPFLSYSLYENLTKRRSVNLFQLSKRNQKKKKKRKSLSLSLSCSTHHHHKQPCRLLRLFPAHPASSSNLLHKRICYLQLVSPPPPVVFGTFSSSTFFFLLNIQTDPKKSGIALNLYYPLCFIRKRKRKKRLKLVIFVIFRFCFRLSSIYVLIF